MDKEQQKITTAYDTTEFKKSVLSMFVDNMNSVDIEERKKSAIELLRKLSESHAIEPDIWINYIEKNRFSKIYYRLPRVILIKRDDKQKNILPTA